MRKVPTAGVGVVRRLIKHRGLSVGGLGVERLGVGVGWVSSRKRGLAVAFYFFAIGDSE